MSQINISGGGGVWSDVVLELLARIWISANVMLCDTLSTVLVLFPDSYTWVWCMFIGLL